MIDGRRRLTRSGLGPRIPEVARRGRELRARSSARARRVACHAGTSCTGASSRFPDRPTRWANPRSTCSGRDLCGHAAVDYRRPSRRPTISSVACGCSAVGSASPCQGEGRGFESRHPLEGAVASTPAVEWPSGEATACKAVHTGSIPVSTSNGFSRARLAQRESASLTRKRSLVQSQYRAPALSQVRGSFYTSFRQGTCQIRARWL